MRACQGVLLLMASSCLASYDEFLSCDRGETDREARAFKLQEAIMEHCDMTKQSFCHQRGSAYPERAIMQFLTENLGLMKRMGSELDPREVRREMRSTSWLVKNSHKDEVVEQELLMEEDREEKTGSFSLGIMPGENMFSGLSGLNGLNINGQKYLLKQGSGLAMVKNAAMLQSRAEPEEPILQSVFRETTRRPSPRRSTSESVRTSSSQTTVRVSSSSSSSAPTTLPTTASIAPSTVTTEMPGTTTDRNTMETTWMFPQEEETTLTAQEYVEYEEYSGDSIEDDQAFMAEDHEAVSELPPVAPYVDLEYPQDNDYIQTLQYEDLEEKLDTDIQPTEDITSILKEVEEDLAEVEKELEPKVEEEEEVTYYGDPINACDVDMSVEAPFWANNTGGKTLALLNLYPFEQYVNMEICLADKEEGLCRRGCRCEQQFRIHRLLAFDPANECRGIFSDWFRFPSFCICKCYGAKEVLQGRRDPKKSDFTPATKKHVRGPVAPAHSMHQMRDSMREPKDSKLSNHRLSDVPAVFPYEGRAALFAELQQYSDQEFEAAKVGRPADSVDTVETLWSLGTTGHMDNTVESDLTHDRKTRKQGRGLETEHFFYNQPIMDFALSDGTVGTLKPRK